MNYHSTIFLIFVPLSHNLQQKSSLTASTTTDKKSIKFNKSSLEPFSATKEAAIMGNRHENQKNGGVIVHSFPKLQLNPKDRAVRETPQVTFASSYPSVKINDSDSFNLKPVIETPQDQLLDDQLKLNKQQQFLQRASELGENQQQSHKQEVSNAYDDQMMPQSLSYQRTSNQTMDNLLQNINLIPSITFAANIDRSTRNGKEKSLDFNTALQSINFSEVDSSISTPKISDEGMRNLTFSDLNSDSEVFKGSLSHESTISTKPRTPHTGQNQQMLLSPLNQRKNDRSYQDQEDLFLLSDQQKNRHLSSSPSNFFQFGDHAALERATSINSPRNSSRFDSDKLLSTDKLLEMDLLQAPITNRNEFSSLIQPTSVPNSLNLREYQTAKDTVQVAQPENDTSLLFQEGKPSSQNSFSLNVIEGQQQERDSPIENQQLLRGDSIVSDEQSYIFRQARYIMARIL